MQEKIQQSNYASKIITNLLMSLEDTATKQPTAIFKTVSPFTLPFLRSS